MNCTEEKLEDGTVHRQYDVTILFYAVLKGFGLMLYKADEIHFSRAGTEPAVRLYLKGEHVGVIEEAPASWRIDELHNHGEERESAPALN